MPRKNDVTTLRVNRRELATILAALRSHADENLQSGKIPDAFIRKIASDGGLKPLNASEVNELCQRLSSAPSKHH